jgi:putative ABC transport system permease protein
MLLFTYMRRELRHRLRQTIFVVVGLAVGIGLVLTVSATSAGVRDAQGKVLTSLYGLGTDITVTKTVSDAQQQPSSGGTTSGSARTVGVGQALDLLTPQGATSFDPSATAQVAKLKGVAAASAELALSDLKVPAAKSLPSGQMPTPTFINVDGVQPGHTNLGPLGQARLLSGRGFTSADTNADVAVVDSGYAAQNKIKVGSTITIAKTAFKVVGIVRQGANPAQQVFVPIARAQTLASLKNQASTMYVAAANATDVDQAAKEIAAALPWATVTTSSSLADQVTGSLTNASKLANELGRWVAIAALTAAFALTVLLTLAAVARRVREFGTLKALGWRTRRIVAQVLGESIVVGAIGGALGVGLGYGGAALVSAIAPTVSAALPSDSSGAGAGPQVVTGGTAGPGGGASAQLGGQSGPPPSVTVHFGTHIALDIVLLALLLGVAAGVLAGGFGGWRAARLRPAAAFRRVA